MTDIIDAKSLLLLETIQHLENKVKDYEQRIADASITLYDYDGYYDPVTKQGNADKLAMVIDDVYTILQGRHWLSYEKHEPLPEEHHDIEE
jgi:hypothetical protein